MQRLAYLILCCILSLGAWGQKVVTQGEYFWDTDPGQGNGTALTAADGNFDQVLENLFQNGIDVSSLSNGPHAFNVRIKGQNGTWSNVFKQTIVVEGPLSIITRTFNVTQGEYFWDTDPGTGNGIPLLALDGNFNEVLEDLFQNGISVGALSIGAHNFSVRIKGQDAGWSPVFRQTIYLEGPLTTITRTVNVVQGEYFWDTDPGQGNGTPLLALDGNFNEVLEDLFQNGISVGALSIGAHNFSTRIKGQDGNWSQVFRQTIYLEGPLTTITRTVDVVQGEYFWDTDPGQGNGTPLLALDGNFNEVLEDLFQNGISVGALSIGAHNFSVRIKGQDAGWSPVFRQTIYLEGPLTTITRTVNVVQGEYFWDTDPGQGNGTPLLALDGNFNEVLEDLFQNGISVGALSLGAHNFSTRIKGQDGNWSQVFRQTIYLEGPLTLITRNFRIIQGEYFWDTDPGQGNGTPLLAFDGNFNTVIENLERNNIDVSALTLGAHNFSVRTKGFDGGWSPVFKQTIYVECSSPTAPSISIAVTGNGACQGTTVQFTATAINGGPTPTYLWKVNGVPAGANSPFFNTATLVNGDIVTCELTSNSGCASPLTATSNNIVVTLTPAVTPTISVSAVPGSTICAGTSVTFTAATTNGGGSPVYVWKVNGIINGSNSATFTSASLLNGDVVTCEFTSNATCAIPATVSSNPITMNVVNSATPFISISSSATAICAGSMVTFTANGSNGGGSAVYQWFVNGSPVGTNNTTYSSGTLNNGDAVSCELTSSLTCVTTPSATSNTIVMSVSPTVATGVSISSSAGSTICSGTNVTFTATPINGGTPVYQWFVNGSPVGTNNASYSSSTLANGDVVTCQMTGSLPCATPATATSNGIAMTVNNSAAPTLAISSSHGSSICGGTNVTFTASAGNGGSAPVYQWFLNGVPVGGNSATYSNTTLANGDQISCTVTSNSPCVNGTSANSNVITLSVTTPVTPTVSVSASATTVCAGTSVTFTATPVNGGGTPDYLWYVNGSPAGTNSATYTSSALNNGDVVWCLLTSSVSCVTTATATSNSIGITVNPIMVTAVSITSNAGTSICDGTNVTFTATPTNGGAPVYQWFVNSVPVGTNSNTYATSTLTNGAIVTCQMTSSLPCATPLMATSNSMVITVNSTAAPTVSITSNQGSPICSGTIVTFTATATNGGPTPAYQWYLNGGPVGTNSATYSNSGLLTGDAVTCVLTSSAPCVSGATATSNAIMITTTAPVTPAVSIAASATTICAGTAVTFTATPVNGGATPAYQWYVNSSPAGTNSAAYTSSTLGNGDVVTCVLTSSVNCVTTTTATSNGVSMTVDPVTTTVVSISSNVGATICAGTNVTFTATPTNGGTPVYQWLVNGLPVGTNSNTYSSSTLVNGDLVTCELTSDLPCATPATAISNTITMTVNGIVTPVVSIVSNQGSSICGGTTVTFTATATNGGPAPVYQWFLNGGPVGNNSSTYNTTTLTNGDQVSCMLTSNAPCVTAATANSNVVTMTVTAPVSASVSISASATTICSGTAVTFTATPVNGGTPDYQWYVNGSQVGTNSNTYTSTSLTNGAVVTCELTSSLPCATPAIAVSNTVTMTVNSSANPGISITSNPASGVICSGASVTFTANSTNGGPNPVFQWKLNGGNVGSNTPTYTNAALVNGDVITCELTSNAPCVSVSTVTSNSITMTVNQSVTPTISITSNPQMPVCDHQMVTFTASITNGGSSPSYQWKKNGQNYGTNSSTYATSLWNDGDVFTCVLTSNAACASPAQVTSNAITMELITLDESVTVNGNTVTSNQSGATYQWFDCLTQEIIPGATQQSYTVTESGLYGVEITLGSCTTESFCEFVDWNSLSDLSAAGIVLYPNPTADYFTLEVPKVAQLELILFDVAGRKVLEQSVNETQQQIDVRALANGSYRLVVSNGNAVYVGKVIINR